MHYATSDGIIGQGNAQRLPKIRSIPSSRLWQGAF